MGGKSREYDEHCELGTCRALGWAGPHSLVPSMGFCTEPLMQGFTVRPPRA